MSLWSCPWYGYPATMICWTWSLIYQVLLDTLDRVYESRWVCCASFCWLRCSRTLTLIAVTHGYGKHKWDLSKADLRQAMKVRKDHVLAGHVNHWSLSFPFHYISSRLGYSCTYIHECVATTLLTFHSTFTSLKSSTRLSSCLPRLRYYYFIYESLSTKASEHSATWPWWSFLYGVSAPSQQLYFNAYRSRLHGTNR